MRTLILLSLLALTLAACADGGVLAKRHIFPHLSETDQIAVINLQPGRADVDMYIAIAGIPAGEEVTYILPFWYEPRGFSMTEEEATVFREECVEPAKDVLKQGLEVEKRLEKHVRQGFLHGAVITGGPAMFFPFVAVPTFGRSSESLSKARLSPYHVERTRQATAELYRGVTPERLPELVQSAGLPDEYAQVLERYDTEHYAVMTLRGVKVDDDTMPLGIHYQFHHPLPEGDSYTYTYPLGTGGAWPHPIELTEVYVTCPTGHYLEVEAPAYQGYDTGTDPQSHYSSLTRFYNEYKRLLRDKAEMPRLLDEAHGEDDREDVLKQLEWLQFREEDFRESYSSSHWEPGETITDPPRPMSAALTDIRRFPNAWHGAYFFSNPTKDIHITVRPISARHWHYPLALWFSESPVGFTILSLIGLLAAWTLGAHIVIRPAWIQAGRPGRYALHAVEGVALVTSIMLFAVTVPVGLYLAPVILSGLPDSLTDPTMTNILRIGVVYLSMLGASYSLYKWLQRRNGDSVTYSGWRLWMYIFVLYLLYYPVIWLVSTWTSTTLLAGG